LPLLRLRSPSPRVFAVTPHDERHLSGSSDGQRVGVTAGHLAADSDVPMGRCRRTLRATLACI